MTTKTPMPGAIPIRKNSMRAPLTGWMAPSLSVFHPGEIITPDKVQGPYRTLREAVLAQAWPTLGEGRGQVMFLLDDAKEKVALYRGGRRSLERRVMFVATDAGSPAAAFIAIEDPSKAPAAITQAVRAGFMVHTFADADTKEARANNTARRDKAFASGAQVISTDFITADPQVGGYQVRMPKGHAAQCNVQFAPQRCGGFDVESGRDSGPAGH